ncbi:hypothetical protein BUALT_Bualt09G0138100 [Buddleja alternifolia]|uniref:Uncharacterized protein n=1 Tax=Buddleja alternifolia TaxID=168488 RepID=A0AAV6XDD7_9LAMI|nr:hypothetical protein BUALT_Bualt09G0138100 [Buddleja alternifolia]
MEEDKKKKRNKKKKNKQATGPKESVTVDAGETTSDNQCHVPAMGQDENGHVSEIINSSADKDGQLANGTERAILEEKIKQLLKEKDDNLQTEASHQEEMKELHDEKNASMQKEASLKEKFILLEEEKDALIHKQDSLEQKIEQFQREKYAHLQKEHDFQASLEVKILQLEGEKDSWVQKEADFREKINQLVDENAALNAKAHEIQVGLQEKIKQMEKERDFWILTENSAKESIARLNNDNINLRDQVISLEQSRDSLFEEKQQLTENISRLQLQINKLECATGSPHSSMNNKLTSEVGDASSETEAAAPALVEKLITENSELVEKVNELYAELDLRGMKTEYVSSVTAQSTDRSALTPDIAVGADDRHGFAQATDSISEARNIMLVLGSRRSLDDVMVEDQSNNEHLNDNNGSGLANSSEIIENVEIVQIPLDENEVGETNLEAAENNDTTEVALTDAPLIGAPFRLISFVARYVSGADLVDKNTGR